MINSSPIWIVEVLSVVAARAAVGEPLQQALPRFGLP
jgi:hypothetical protein